MDSYAEIPLQYTLGNSSPVRDTIRQVIPFGDSIEYTFKKKVDLSVPDVYNLTVTTKMTGDDDATNDAIIKSLYAQPTYRGRSYRKFRDKRRLVDTGISAPGELGMGGTRIWNCSRIRHPCLDDPSPDFLSRQ